MGRYLPPAEFKRGTAGTAPTCVPAVTTPIMILIDSELRWRESTPMNADDAETRNATDDVGTGEHWAVLTKLLLPAVTAARSHVELSEEVFVTHTFHADPRGFFLLTALDEITKTGVFLMKLDGLLDGAECVGERDKQPDPIERAIQAVVIEEVRLRGRRLCELLVQLVLFSGNDSPDLYRHFLLLREIESDCGFNQDLEEFHGAPSDWVGETIAFSVREARSIEQSIDPNDAWYAGRHKRPVDSKQWRNLLSSVRSRVQRALPTMTDFERLSVGSTYQEAFGEPSRTVHFQPSPALIPHTPANLVTEGTKLGMIAACALRRIYIILGRPSEPRLEQITRVLESNGEAARLMGLLNERKEVEVGDFVTARGYLGQVVEERRSQYGYRSVRVELLAERPHPSLAADWFRVRDVTRIFSKQDLVVKVRKAADLPDADVDDAILRQSIVESWNLGLREDIWRNIGWVR